MSRKLFATICLVTSFGLMSSACVTNRTFGGGLDDFASDVSLKGRLLNDAKYDYSDVDIVVYEGRLMLTGTMRSNDGKWHAKSVAASAANVQEVINEIIIAPKTTFRQGTSDALIDEKLGLALLADNGIYRSNYQIAVSGGVVYLLGVAQGPNELTRVTDHARNIRGVNKVVSHVIYVGDPKRNTRQRL